MSDKVSWGTAVVRGLLGGLGWGLAIGTAHLVVGIGLIVSMGMPPLTWFAAKSVVYEMILAAGFGLVTVPVYRHAQGRWIQAALLSLSWFAMERFVAVDPTKPLMWLGPTLVATLLFIGSRVLAERKSPVIPVVAAISLNAVALAIPVIKDSMSEVPGSAGDIERGEAAADAPDILFVVLDTVRAKSSSAYGYPRNTTPRFDAFAGEGVLFEDANSPATWSLPAHGSLFTGTFPSVHGSHGEHDFLDDKLPTLASVLTEAGYETRCFTANPHLTENFGLLRGFAWTDQAWITGAGGRGFSFIYRFMDELGFQAEDKGGNQVASNVEHFLRNRPDDAPPAFVFVNFLEAHFPFHQLPDAYLDAMTSRPRSELRDASLTAFGLQFGREMSAEERAELYGPMVDMYDAGVLYSDALFGRVLDAFAEENGLDDTVIVVLGDHGEMVGEHGAYGHLASVYQPDLHVPLAIRYPKRIAAGSRVAEPISTVGAMATVLDLAGVAVPESVQVGTLMPALEGRPAGQPVLAERFEKTLLAERFAPGTGNGFGPLLDPRGRYRTYRSGVLKLAIRSTGETYLFDLLTDPNEENDIAASSPMEVQRLQQEIAVWQQAIGLPEISGEIATGAPREIDAAAMEQLRALGYVE